MCRGSTVRFSSPAVTVPASLGLLTPCWPPGDWSRTITDFDVGQLLPIAVEPSGISGLVSG